MTIYNKEEKRFGLLFLYVSFTCRTFVVNASQISIIIYKKLSGDECFLVIKIQSGAPGLT